MSDEYARKYDQNDPPQDAEGNIDYRRPCARDYDRILYSPELRRLGGVTQVMDSMEIGLLHTRLMHSFKVAQTARSIAKYIQQNYPHVQVDVDAAEAAGLAHDIGHPPFGHVAESVLDKLMDQVDDGFEGNAQTFRILTRLSTRNANHRGLDLTRKTLQAITKYPWGRKINNSKFNYYSSDKEYFDWSRDGLKNKKEKTLEAEIMDWADDIAYAIHDLEDFAFAGLIPMRKLVANINNHSYNSELRRFFDYARDNIDSSGILDDNTWQTKYEHPVANILIMYPTSPTTITDNQRVSLSCFVSLLVNRFVKEAISINDSGHLVINDEHRRINSVLKQITWFYVIDSPNLAYKQQGQRKIIQTLFEFLNNELRKGHTWILPPWCREPGCDYRSDENKRKRSVCDYIASLTEPQAITLFQNISGINAAGGDKIAWA